jgi:LEA14-like dessication related protein
VAKNAWTDLKVTGSLGENEVLKTKIKAEDWNEIRLVVKGNRLQHYVNGILMSDVTDNDTVNGKSKGLLGVQVHVGPPMKVQYRNIKIKNL